MELAVNILCQLKRAQGKPADVIFYRGLQLLSNKYRFHRNLWPELQRKSRKPWGDIRRERLSIRLIDQQAIRAIKKYYENHPDAFQRKQIDRLLEGYVEIFGQPYRLLQNPNNVDWHTDWRYGYTWSPKYFTEYSFYDFDKAVPYDIKFPWELSRLNFLPRLALVAALEKDSTCYCFLEQILEDWKEKNPLAHSVVWDPMETSMRGINLFFAAQIAISAEAPAKVSKLLLELLHLQGLFVYRTAEYTGVNSNHFAANIACLLLLGDFLGPTIPEANSWKAFALKHLEREILRQFFPDGVQFEKSTSYHRLVTQLFMLCAIVRRKEGYDLSKKALERLENACSYTQAYTKPDGMAPVWGDSDDARALWFDVQSSTDHRSLCSLGSAFFQVPSLASKSSADIPLLLGKQPLPCLQPENKTRHFPQGEMLTFHSGGTHLIVDIGEVGLRGKGGHGHLDMLSFELSLDGQSLIVDPGSFIYTGDPKERNIFRSTSYHNVLQVEDYEMGTVYAESLWQLGNEARPKLLHQEEKNGCLSFIATHAGYQRFHPSSEYQRRFQVTAGRFEVFDQFKSEESTLLNRHFHFESNLALDLHHGRLLISHPNGLSWEATWDCGAEPRLAPSRLSKNYGQIQPSVKLILQNHGQADTELSFRIASVRNS